MKICEKCNGTGNITVPVTEHLGSVLCGMEQCDVCDGTGEISTNFDRITESPEKLAEFLGTWFVLPCELCEHFRNDKCTAKISERRCDDAEAFEKWLNEESKE